LSIDIENKINRSIEALEKTKELSKQIINVIEILISCLQENNKIILFGNGGSAADAQHIAAELVGRFKLERRSLPAIALTTDTSIITAVANDYSFDKIFSRQCESLVSKGDVVIGISTSGNSNNVIEGIKVSKNKGAKTIGILGNSGGNLKDIVDVSLIIPSKSTPIIQECHRVITHIICEIIEEKFFNNN